MYGSTGAANTSSVVPLRRPGRRGARARGRTGCGSRRGRGTRARGRDRSARRASSAGRGSAPAPTRRASSPARRRRAPWGVAPAPGRWRCAAAGRRRTRAGSGGATRVDADRREHLGDRDVVGPSTSRPTSGSATMSATVMRGSSELSGSWNTICTSRRNQRSAWGRPGTTGGRRTSPSRASPDRGRGGCGRASTCPSPTRRRCRACRRRRREADAGEGAGARPGPPNRRGAAAGRRGGRRRRRAGCRSRSRSNSGRLSPGVAPSCGGGEQLDGVRSWGAPDAGRRARSTMMPRRITRTSSATIGTRATSWVMNSRAVSSSAISSASSVEHTGLHRDVEGRRRFVGDEQRRTAGQRHGDADALALPPDSWCG